MKPDYIDFQDRSVALAFLITFRCYGTWLHGDERGSVDRRFRNRYGEAKIKTNPGLKQAEREQVKGQPFILGPADRLIVETAIREVCVVRGYPLFALNVRTNHVHLVVGNARKVERIMDALKAYATRALRNAARVLESEKRWSRHGSTRYLWTERHIELAVDYVANGQGGDLPAFE